VNNIKIRSTQNNTKEIAPEQDETFHETMDVDSGSSSMFKMRPRTNSASSNDNKIVAQLMEYSMLPGDASQDQKSFQENAVRSLVRRLRRAQEKGTLNNLIRAITTKDRDTACIRIPRSLDGRMQVRQKKTIPHVLFCQIFRWDNLKSYHELQGIVSCRFAYDMSQSSGEICVNPYHYERLSHSNHGRMQYFRDDGFDQGYVNNYQNYPISNHGGINVVSSLARVHGEGSYVVAPTLPDHQQTDLNIQLPGNEQHIILTEVPQSGSASIDSGTQMETYRAISGTQYGGDQQKMPWCKILYYELKDRCGEPYEGVENTIRIDAGTNPYAQSRFCLGRIANNKRNKLIEQVRTSIGRGIELSGGHQHSRVELWNNSNQKVFVQSAMWNEKDGIDAATVRGIPAGQKAEVFDNQAFARKLQSTTVEGTAYESVAQLANVCKVRISFVKGWGAAYRRSHIDSCECWIEISLLDCLQWLDTVLEQMGNPQAISSGSTKPQDGTRGQTNQNSNGMNEVEQSQLSHVAFESASQDDLVSFDEPKYHPAG